MDVNNTNQLKYTVFISGAAVMVIEILGGRIIAPYYGSSTYVWSALISVILASLALGYYVGGQLADISPSVRRLSLILLVSALMVFLIPFVKQQVFLMSLPMGVYLGSIFAPLILLSLPGIFLGMVSPYTVKIAAKHLENLGTIAGDLYALSTVGSIAGTFATGFILIPNFRISSIFFGIALVLALTSSYLYVKNTSSIKLGRQTVFSILLISLILVSLATYTTSYPVDKKLLHVEYTPYNQIMVLEDENNRYLSLDGSAEGAIRFDTNYSLYEYANYFEIPFLMRSEIKDVLVAGEGAGVGPRQIKANHPGTHVTVSEINPRVHEIAKEYFMVDDSEIDVRRVGIRSFIQSTNETYDYVILDAYNGFFTIPFHILTLEFFHGIKGILNPDGIVLMNIITPPEGSKSHLFRCVLKTVAEEFKYIRIYPTEGDDTSVQNVILIASNTPLGDEQSLYDKANDTVVLSKAYITHMLDKQLLTPIDYSDGILLTDDYSPVNYLYMPLLGEHQRPIFVHD